MHGSGMMVKEENGLLLSDLWWIKENDKIQNKSHNVWFQIVSNFN